ncbi:hypothetical protein [Sphingomonas immobilis]|uniref:Uncharacterized protein n=1 Tax=Sphingomonas immobilis TaxID=3063997 RepID=A0ABT9A3W6_9SPHN|nr:hypothetical protein [Sphingomonas sp. CA1-15]MDO7843427.1 hypothetical protein [Sphingomonas sp. CA1-15]
MTNVPMNISTEHEMTDAEFVTAPAPKVPTEGDSAGVFEAHARWVREQQRAYAPDTKSFSGSYLVWRRAGARLRKGTPGGGGNPKFRHSSFEAAETEAKRLLGLFPESSFVILQEVARVKLQVTGEAGDAS